MILLPHDALDVPLCLTSGQTFRWKPQASIPGHSTDFGFSISDFGGQTGAAEPGPKPVALTGQPTWIGADGDNAFRFIPIESGWTIDGDPARARALFRLETDLPELHTQLRKLEPRLQPCFDLLPGLRMLRPSDPWEVLCSFLCTANNHLPRITSMVQRLASCGPELASFEGTKVHRFPAPAEVAALGEAQLREWGFGYRGKTIPHVAAQVAEWGPGWADELRSEGYEAVWRRLMTLPGVGPKVADCVCLYGLHFDEAAPLDTHLWNAAAALYAPDQVGVALTDLRYRRMGSLLRDRFGALTGWAHLYLYFHRLRTWRQA